MTQISSFIPPSHRAGDLGVHSLDHFGLIVPDLVKAEHFYKSFGLDVRGVGGELALHTFGQGHRWAGITEGLEKKLHYLSFGAFEEDFPRFREKLDRLKIERISPPSSRLDSGGLWFCDPDGILIEIKICDKSSPDRKTAFGTVSSPANIRGAVSRSEVQLIQPSRLAHVLLFATDVSRSVRFYTSVLGLRLTDRSQDDVAFMHGIHGSDHHMIALAKSIAPGFHHCSWTVTSLDEIGLGAMQMAQRGFSSGWGLGRHVIGSNYFHYVRDPWSSYSEYSCDIDYIAVDQEWNSCDYPSEDRSYLWGAARPADFGFNYEAVPRP
ncbi:MAG: VOC family protein [Acidobacteriota bacterium]|nr:VOC family protein [Acidobacteriota bacterium]